MTTKPAFAMDKPEYITEVTSWGRQALLLQLHRLGLKQGNLRLSDVELAELLWNATQPTRERSRANWEATR